MSTFREEDKCVFFYIFITSQYEKGIWKAQRQIKLLILDEKS